MSEASVTRAMVSAFRFRQESNFVGDYIDRGPKIKETLAIVKSMVDNDSGYALLGNHEYNALCYHTTKEGHNRCLAART